MTRTPAPIDDAHLDQALREVAEHWRLDFEVPPIPLLESASGPLETRAPGRSRWTRPVLVAASIVALGAVTAVVISTARPTGQTAGPSVPAGPSVAAGPSLPVGLNASTRAPEPDPVWPVPGLQTLQILDGTPPSSITRGGSVYRLASATAPVDVVTDSDHPNFLGVTPQSIANACQGTAFRIYLDRTSSGTIGLTEAAYQREGLNGPCPETTVSSEPKYGLAPYPIAGQRLTAAASGGSIEHVDLADYRAPRHLPDGYQLGSSFSVQPAAGVGNSAQTGHRVGRVLTTRQGSSSNDITLVWYTPVEARTSIESRSSFASRGITCTSRLLAADLMVSACGNTLAPQRRVTIAELQRVVDSIPD